MGRRRPIDRVNWRLYRRAWLLPALAFVLVLGTSFAPQRTPDSPLPPSFTNEQASELIDRAAAFSKRFPDRRPGTPGAIDAGQWLRDQLRDAGLTATTVPATTTRPTSGDSVGIANVEAVLPGRTRETVVVLAHRDNLGSEQRGGDPIGTLSLVQLAEDLAATRDRRRTFLLVSTDAATINGAGARALAERLQRRRGSIVAIVSLERPGSGGRTNWVPFLPAGDYVPPLGLTQAARDAVVAEGGDAGQPSILSQLLRLSVPTTLFGHGPLVEAGLPAVTISGGYERSDSARLSPTPTSVGDAVRSLQRALGTLDSVDTLQSAGKTYVSTSQRVYRGWALKILIASLLLPVWFAAADMLLRHRRSWNIAATVGTAARAVMAGLFGLITLWLTSSIGLLPGSADRPPMPASVDSLPVVGLMVWVVLAGAGWLLARGPDWRRARAAGRDSADLAVALLAGCVLCAVMLASSPYSVLLFVPALHLWLVLASRLVYSTPATAGTWGAGLLSPLASVLALGAASDTGIRAPIYALELVASRSVPAGVTLPAAALSGLGLLVLLASFGRVGAPALPAVRRTAQGLEARAVLTAIAGLRHLPRDAARARARQRARSRRARPIAALPGAGRGPRSGASGGPSGQPARRGPVRGRRARATPRSTRSSSRARPRTPEPGSTNTDRSSRT